MKQDKVGRETVEQLIEAFSRLRYTKMKQSFPSVEWKKTEAKALMFLNEENGEGKMASEISRALHVTSPFVTQLLNRMEKKGLVLRRMDEDDKRIVRIFLTDEGKKAADDALKGLNRWFLQLSRFLGEDESRQFADLILKLSEFIEHGEKTSEKKVER
ncbi:MarR family transcriptional regulator [Bacillus haynesii]|uniref:MarR family transcriptional regulator n=1 Tax=Bacillus haynesii TaxID=1925021 RepID=A0ABX3I3C9_9BACI|nr:MarR family transcriptional regulator [Bacillus haynesii]OMI26537.1 MarR family transcriptional regulator [Bacillus haynesii]